MRYGRRSGTAPTRSRSPSLNRPCGGATAWLFRATSRLMQCSKASSFDHLVGAGEQVSDHRRRLLLAYHFSYKFNSICWRKN
jgi:hypothetical protein